MPRARRLPHDAPTRYSEARLSAGLLRWQIAGNQVAFRPGNLAADMTQDDNGDKPGTKAGATSSGPAGVRGLGKPSTRRTRVRSKAGKRGYLDGQMLIAMPT